MKKQRTPNSADTPAATSREEKTAPPAANRRPARHLLYGPLSISMDGVEEIPAELPREVEADPDQADAVEQGSEFYAAEESLPVEPRAELAGQADETRAGKLVSRILETEKRDLPEWMAELLDPLDETAQLAFILKHRAEIRATRRGRVGVPASPDAGIQPPDHRQAVQTHRRVYDTF